MIIATSSAAAAAFVCVWGFDLVMVPNVLPLAPGLAIIGFMALSFQGISKLKRWDFTGTELALLLLCGWVALSMRWSVDPKATLLMISQYGSAFLAYMMVRRLSVRKVAWRRIGWSYIYGCLIAALYFLVFSKAASDNLRYGIEGINANYIAYSLVSGFPVLLTLLRTGEPTRRWRSILVIVWMVIVIAAILLTGSRGATLSTLLCLLVWILGWKRRPLPTSLGAVALGVVATLVILAVLPPEIRGRLEVHGEIDSAYRFDTWPIALNLITEHPLTGIGAGGFPSANRFGLLAHNLLLSLGSELGVPGILMYFLVLVGIYRTIAVRVVPELSLCRTTLFIAWLPIAFTGAWDISFVAWLVFAWFAATSSWASGAQCHSSHLVQNPGQQCFTP